VAAAEGLKPFYDRRPDIAVDEKAAAKFLTPENKATLAQLADAIAPVEPWTAPAIEQATNAFLAARALDMKKVGQPARVALTGTAVSPPLFDCMEIYGRDVTLARLRR
jgi:glutamyl-tRNA synthetase